MSKTKKHSLRNVLIIALSIVLIAAVIVLGASAYVVSTTRDDVFTIEQLEQKDVHADAILVLGASVFADGTPSDILADRLDVACDIYKAGVAPVMIASGDGRETHYDESDAMKAYCEKLGVPGSAVYVDRAGYDTYASVWRAKNIYGANSIVITTQAYHLYRALAIAEGLGMKAYGVPADKGNYEGQATYSIREQLSRTKALFMTMVNAKPEDTVQPISN